MKANKRGGKREGAGRPRIAGDIQVRRNITLSESLAEKAKQIGDGNLSEGVRRAIEAFKTRSA